MMRLRRALFALIWFFGASLVIADDLVPIPPLQARVTDLTGSLSPEQTASLEQTLAELQKTRGSQVVILMLPTTGAEAIEQFGIRLAGAWKIGRKGVHDGVIVLVAKDDHRMRIEVGYGLEGAIPDAIAKRIVSDIMAPKFRRNDFYGGLQDGTAAIAAAIAREPLPAPDQDSGPTTASFSHDPNDWMFGLFALVILAGIAHRLLGMAGSGIAAVIGGVLAWAIFGSLLVALVAAVIVFFGSFARGGGRGMGGFGGGGFGGGGFGGGGFSGGGGGFGGGGASGRW